MISDEWHKENSTPKSYYIHNLWSCRLFRSIEFDGQSLNSNTVKQMVENGKKKSLGWQRRGRYILSLVPGVKNWGSGMVLNPTGCTWFTTAGCLWSDYSWSWTFQIAQVTLHACEVAPMTSQTLTRVIFPLSVWPSSTLNLDLGPSPSDSPP